MAETPILETRGITVRFGGHVAVKDVSLGIEPGTVTGLIGPNGAGKTTLFNTITGLQRPTVGKVFLDGRDITSLPPYKRARMGMARTFQRLELFVSLSVRDNLRVAGDIHNANGRNKIDLDEEVDRLLELTGLADIASTDVSDVPTGRARVVEVARALMTSPRVLLLDEPASGQTEQETEAFAALLRDLADSGLAICLVEHDIPLVMKICSRIHVLDYGAVLASGVPDEIKNDPAVINAYIGTEEEAV
ncbi:ABC transporter ATP-binding protein [Rhodococcus pyridinivorans]|uniref:ABC transporter ATP-binding protein n=1 Tax=Rhodococcus pyridinivorans AK37 TaxID=1114960 RepID=H0JN30_9NOCA|nr:MULTISPECIES: ABC transporter ATP-binding protein [Rhodococcus]AWZ26696.1 ABC transporter ATP-binding protein [Rhodococcus pyridinivorans]EHK85108.1 ABC transporter ATP-binding protein [Rhodococcus pyridinivorans AK37]MCD2143136.1 ABC transporter ATP-binding protein [Rhodococcus pyridinivorans]MCW3469660.1 ABC transporter ATP-binding protein [Rhodococcus pyridinivorans]OBA38402.1 ABC transporter ATP-binding protein [Rhodococcus sp. 852002-51564_SCH6189132-a]